LLTTPIQIAAAYAPLVNGWYYVKPTVVAGIRDGKTGKYSENTRTIVRQIFKPDTADAIKDALFSVIDENPWLQKLAWIPWYSLWWKSWTSQIAFRGKYQQWLWWTNASFVGLVTRDNPNYIVVVQVRRPRSSQRWWQTAWKIFKDIASFLVDYSLIDS
jgi:cell division protein FtsI/penicillin-binding protein 2